MVGLVLRVRRFRCDTTTCVQRFFAERMPELAVPYARRTTRLQAAHLAVAATLGGLAAARLATRQRMPVSRNTLLRALVRRPPAAHPPPRIVGIDDWAWKKGHRYGSILVDHERQCVLDLLPDRTAETVVAALARYPSIELVTRDRAPVYREAITQALPHAIQVADRWHLLHNLHTMLADLCVREARRLPWLMDTRPAKAPPKPERTLLTPTEPVDAHLERRRRYWKTLYDDMLKLHMEGHGQARIATYLGISARTVARWLKAGEPVERIPRGSFLAKRLEPFKDFMDTYFATGGRNATELRRRLQAQGYTGGYLPVAIYMNSLRRAKVQASEQRRAEAQASDKRRAAPPPLPPPPPPQRATKRMPARQAAWLLTLNPATLTDHQRAQLTTILETHAELAEAYTLAQGFAAMVRTRTLSDLAPWLEAAQASSVLHVRRFAKGLRNDQAAVEAALIHPYSNGPVEGHIHRLKLIKRSMYGRAGLAL